MRLDVLKDRDGTAETEEELVARIARRGEYGDTSAMENAWDLAAIPTVRGDGAGERIAQATRRSPETIRLLRRLGKAFTPEIILAPATADLYERLNISHLTAVLPVVKRDGLERAQDWLYKAGYGDEESDKEGVDRPWPIQYFKRRMAIEKDPNKPAPLSLASVPVEDVGRTGYGAILLPITELGRAGLGIGSFVVANVRKAKLETAE